MALFLLDNFYRVCFIIFTRSTIKCVLHARLVGKDRQMGENKPKGENFIVIRMILLLISGGITTMCWNAIFDGETTLVALVVLGALIAIGIMMSTYSVRGIISAYRHAIASGERNRSNTTTPDTWCDADTASDEHDEPSTNPSDRGT